MSERQRGRFITLEGIEGSGKSTMLIHIRGWLKGQGLEVETTREAHRQAVRRHQMRKSDSARPQ